MVGGPFRMVFVCTGNIHRSPTAEILTRHLLKGRLGGRDAARFEVSSAGVHAVVGAPMHPMSRAQLAPWGLDGAHSARFVARQLRREVVADADLVLGASPHHRSAVLEDMPDLLDRTFSLREFARLAAAVPPDALPQDLVACSRALVEQARGLRGRVPAPDDDRVPDPVGGPPEAHQLATTLIFESVRSILDALAPRPGPRRPPTRPVPPPQTPLRPPPLASGQRPASSPSAASAGSSSAPARRSRT